MNFVLRTAHAEERKKKGVTQTLRPDVHTIIVVSRSEPHTIEFYAFLGILVLMQEHRWGRAS